MINVSPGWRNWQTRQLEGLVGVSPMQVQFLSRAINFQSIIYLVSLLQEFSEVSLDVPANIKQKIRNKKFSGQAQVFGFIIQAVAFHFLK